jgi:hypothetical protein
MIHGFKGAIDAMVRTFLFLGLAALTQAQTCSNATYRGTYCYLVSGTTSSSGSTVPYAQLGKLTADGNGNLTGFYWQNTNGVLSQVPVTETYTVRADCYGKAGTGTGSSFTAISDFQLVQGGQEVFITSASTTPMLTGQGYRAAAQGASQCGNGSLAGWYGWLGTTPAGAPYLPKGGAMMAEYLLDGKGGFTTLNPSLNGTYSIAGDCSGTLVVNAVGAAPAANYLIEVVESGNFLIMQSDPNSFTFGMGKPVSPPTVLPQVAFGGGWYTALYFTNPTSAAVSFAVNFTADNGSALPVPALGGSSTTVSIPAHGTAIIEALNSGSLSEGYATFTLPPGVVGYGVFRQSVTGRPDQEAVVPFATANAASSTLVWDDTSFITAIAIANAGPVAATISVTLWDNDGNVVGTSTVNLPAGQKTEAALRSLPGLAGMVGLRGRAQFSATSGNVAVLGLRFVGWAFTSIPAQQ